MAHLEDAYISVRQKAAMILRLEQELEVFKRASTPANTNSSGFELVPGPPGTPRSDPSQVFEELGATRASIIVCSLVPRKANCWMGQAQGNPDTPRGALSEPPSTPDKLGDSLQSNSAYCRQVYINSSALVREPYTPTTPTPSDDQWDQVSAYMHHTMRKPLMWYRSPSPRPRKRLQPNGRSLRGKQC